jgi:hypothetical protein
MMNRKERRAAEHDANKAARKDGSNPETTQPEKEQPTMENQSTISDSS